MTRSLSARLTNLAMMGWGSSAGALRLLGRRWLTLMSLTVSWGSSSSTLLAKDTRASVVSSWVSLMPQIRRLCRRPCCSRASLASRSCWTSVCRASIWVSRSARADRSEVTSDLREEMESTRSLLAPWTILVSLSTMAWSLKASTKESLKAVSCSSSWWGSGSAWVTELWANLVLLATDSTCMVSESGHWVNSCMHQKSTGNSKRCHYSPYGIEIISPSSATGSGTFLQHM